MTYEPTNGGASVLEDRRKPYEVTPDGGFRVRTERRIGEVRVPNYVYDLWLPVLGMDAVALYSVYCRMERNDTIRGMNQKTLAGLCRIGTDKLNKLNADLEACGFIRIERPAGAARLAHHCTTVVVLDPPKEVPAQAIAALCPDGELKHGTLKDWLIDPVPAPSTIPPENGFRDAGAEIQERVEDGFRNATLGNPLNGNPLSSEESERTRNDARDWPPPPDDKAEAVNWNPYHAGAEDYLGGFTNSDDWLTLKADLQRYAAEGLLPKASGFRTFCQQQRLATKDETGKWPYTLKPLAAALRQAVGDRRAERERFE